MVIIENVGVMAVEELVEEAIHILRRQRRSLEVKPAWGFGRELSGNIRERKGKSSWKVEEEVQGERLRSMHREREQRERMLVLAL